MDAQLQEADAAGAQRKALADFLKVRAQDRSMAQNQAAADAAMGNGLVYPASKPTVQQTMDTAQDMADQMAINLTEEELRDGLFIEPKFKLDDDGNLVGKMGIPDAFLQDKTPIPSKYNLFMDDAQFDPDDPYAEPSAEELPLWVDHDGNYFPIYDDMGLGEPFIPTDNVEPADGPYGETLFEIYDNVAKFQNKEKFEKQYADVINTTADFKIARANAQVKQAEEQIKVAKKAIKANNEARATVQDAARKPVYTPKKTTSTSYIGRRYGL